MRVQNLILCFIAILLFLSLIQFSSALTAKIGNGIMVLHLDYQETVEKYVKVINDNNVSVTIELAATGDLADYVSFREDNFSLAPGEYKNAYFTIQAAKKGTTQTKINIKYTPEQGNGVGLSSLITVITEGDSSDNEETQDIEDNKENLTSGITTGQVTNASERNSKVNPAILLTVSTIILIIILIALLAYSSKRKKLKRKKRMKESNA